MSDRSDQTHEGSGTPEDVEQPHDSFFRQLMASPAVAREMLHAWLPVTLTAALDWTTLESAQAGFVDADLRQSQSDCLFTVRATSVTPDSTPVCIYVLVEHQSTVDVLMPLRMLRYMLRDLGSVHAHEREHPASAGDLPCGRTPGPGSWTASPVFQDLVDVPAGLQEPLRGRIPSFSHEVVDLANLDPKVAESLVAWIVSQGMRAARRGDAFILEFLNTFPAQGVEFLQKQPWGEIIRGLLYYLAVVARELTWDDIGEAAAQGGLDKEIFMGLVERTRQEAFGEGLEEGLEQGLEKGLEQGLEKGLEQGLEKGRRQEVARMIDLALVNRFRIAPGSVIPRLETIASIDQLEALFQSALTAASLEEFMAMLETRTA